MRKELTQRIEGYKVTVVGNNNVQKRTIGVACHENNFNEVVKLFEEGQVDRPHIVVLCGSTRFYEQFQQANFEETMKGNIVLTVGFYPHADFSKTPHGEDVGVTVDQKRMLDELHLRKIDLADEVFVLNVGGYIGDSTGNEIDYAMNQGKPIRYLVPFDEGAPF